MWFHQYSGSEKNLDKRGGTREFHDFAFDFLLFSQSTDKFRWGKLRCFRKFQVSKMIGIREGVGITVFHREFFVPQY